MEKEKKEHEKHESRTLEKKEHVAKKMSKYEKLLAEEHEREKREEAAGMNKKGYFAKEAKYFKNKYPKMKI